MVADQVIFHGDDKERIDLLAALERNCECDPANRCGAHKMLESQRVLDWLLFERRQRLKLLTEEGPSE